MTPVTDASIPTRLVDLSDVGLRALSDLDSPDLERITGLLISEVFRAGAVSLAGSNS